MKIHNFKIDAPEQEYHKILFCTKCGQVAWPFNWSKEINADLQSKIKPCVEDDLLVQPTPLLKKKNNMNEYESKDMFGNFLSKVPPTSINITSVELWLLRLWLWCGTLYFIINLLNL